MANPGGEKRVAISVNLSPTSRAVVENIRDDTGVPNTTAVERILTWFAAMPRKFRVALLTGDTDGQQEMLIAWFKETMQAHGKSIEITEGDDVYARLKLIRQLVDEFELAYAKEKVKNTGSTGKVKKKG